MHSSARLCVGTFQGRDREPVGAPLITFTAAYRGIVIFIAQSTVFRTSNHDTVAFENHRFLELYHNS